jgi:hypothetical protein
MSPASLQTFIDTPNRVLEYRVQYKLNYKIPSNTAKIVLRVYDGDPPY